MIEGRQLVAIDDRYVVTREDSDIQMRLAISHGPNITRSFLGPAILSQHVAGAVPGRGPLMPHIQKGNFVFGLHHVGIDLKGKKLAFLDSWMDSYDARRITGARNIVAHAKRLLAAIDDEHYQVVAGAYEEEGGNLEFGRAPFHGPWTEVPVEEL